MKFEFEKLKDRVCFFLKKKFNLYRAQRKKKKNTYSFCVCQFILISYDDRDDDIDFGSGEMMGWNGMG